MSAGEFRREIRFEDGASSVRFLLHGEQGTTQFLMSTGIIARRAPAGRYLQEWDHRAPSGYDLGHHWDVAQYPDQEPAPECNERPSGQCFYDGSGLAAQPVLDRFVLEGEDAVWDELMKHYEYVAAKVVERSEETTDE